METVKRLFIIYGIFLNIGAAGADMWDDRIINLRGVWKFNIGDRMEWADPNYDDSNWEDIYVPSEWEDEGFHGYDGYAWYRVAFEITGDADYSSLYLSLGYIDDVDEVYINGQLIGFSGSFPPDFHTAYNSLRKYPIPEEVINKGGVNVIAVRIFDTVHQGGIVSGSVGIYESRNRASDAMAINGLWKVRNGDDDEWRYPDYNDDDWERIMAPSFLRKSTRHFYRDSFRKSITWYRKEFYLPDHLKDEEELVLVLGKIDDFDKTYLNGKLIGFTKDNRPLGSSGSYNEFRIYVLLNEYLNRDGRNVISVRVEDIGGDAGIYEGPLGIVPIDQYERFID